MASTYLTRTMSAGTNTKATYSAWIKKSSQTQGFLFQSYTDNSNLFIIRFKDGHSLNVETTSGGSNILEFTTSSNANYLRDVSGWYHIVVSLDSTQATSTDRVKLYVNNEQMTNFSVSTYPSLNADLKFNNSSQNNILGAFYYSSAYSNYLDGMMAHVYWIDGTAYAPTDFGEYDANGVWTPKTDVSVTYGTNGFFLKFENSGSMGTDSSGNTNNFTVNGNLTQTLDTPSNVYCTINQLDNYLQQATLSNGNTSVTTGSSQSTYTRGTLGMSAGKWYWEMKMTNTSPAGNLNFGIVNAPTGDAAQRLRGASTTNSVAATDYNYAIYANGVSTGINGEIVAQNDIVMFAFDADNNGLYIGKNGSWYNSGDPTSGASKTGAFTPGTAGLDYFPAVGDENGSAGYSVQFNFGNGYFGTTAVASAGSNGNGSIFEYDVPTGYYALNTKNLATYG